MKSELIIIFKCDSGILFFDREEDFGEHKYTNMKKEVKQNANI